METSAAKVYVMDASAMIAVLAGEEGGDVVAGLLNEKDISAHAHVINLFEVFYDYQRRGDVSTAQQAMLDLQRLGIQSHGDLDDLFWQEAASLKAIHAHVSLADCFGLTLTRRLNGTFVTSDHHEMDRLVPLGICSILFFRKRTNKPRPRK